MGKFLGPEKAQTQTKKTIHSRKNRARTKPIFKPPESNPFDGRGQARPRGAGSLEKQALNLGNLRFRRPRKRPKTV